VICDCGLTKAAATRLRRVCYEGRMTAEDQVSPMRIVNLRL
jgi:hypothetical protein